MASPRAREEPTTQEQIGALVDDRLLTLLGETFPRLEVKPGVPMDTVLYEAGIQRVVDFLATCQRLCRDQD